MLKTLSLVLLASVSAAHGKVDVDRNIGKARFCEIRMDRHKLIGDLKKEENLLTLENNGGLLGLRTGVCWWHSRLQRRMSYLADFRPALPKPTDQEVKLILRKIKRGKNVVTIPGFKNLGEFSKEHSLEIQKSLNAWMLGDTVLRQNWIRGTEGKPRLSPERMKVHLEKMYADFKGADGIVVQVLQNPGLMAHSWLLANMKKLNSKEYEIEIIDSNTPDMVLRYVVSADRASMQPAGPIEKSSSGERDAYFATIAMLLGEDSKAEDIYRVSIGEIGEFVSYTQYSTELKKIKNVVKDYCSDASEQINNNNSEEEI